MRVFRKITDNQLVERFKVLEPAPFHSEQDMIIDLLVAKLKLSSTYYNSDICVHRDENTPGGTYPVVVYVAKTSAIYQPNLQSIPLTARVLSLSSLQLKLFSDLVSNSQFISLFRPHWCI